MKQKLNCIMLIDDDKADNRFHQIIIESLHVAGKIEIFQEALEALEFLKKENQIHPELIFLDINMPKVNGWEFLEEYKKLNDLQKTTVVVLTTSTNPTDKKKAENIPEISGFVTKPLSEEILNGILERHFHNSREEHK